MTEEEVLKEIEEEEKHAGTSDLHATHEHLLGCGTCSLEVLRLNCCSAASKSKHF